MPRHRRGWAMVNGYPSETRHSPLSVSMLEPALLVLLKEQPRHGYNLLTDLEDLGLRSLHPSVVYRALRQMESLDWIHSEWDTSQTQGPPRRNYHLTDLGEKVLKNWQDEMSQIGNLINELLQRTKYL